MSQLRFINAMVEYNTSGYHRHRLRDIRVDGAFVEMGNVRVLRKDSLVRVVFVHHERGHAHTHRLEAKVASVESNGALIRFLNLDDQAQRALSTLQA